MTRKSDYYSDSIPCEAEIVRVSGEEFIVEKRVDMIANRHKKKSGPWVADWCGCGGIKGFGINGYSREEVVQKMAELIKRKKDIQKIRELIMQRKLRKEAMEMLKASESKKVRIKDDRQ